MTTVDSEPLVRENPDCKELMLEVGVADMSRYLSVVCQSKFKTLTKLMFEVRVADLQIYRCVTPIIIHQLFLENFDLMKYC